MALRYAIRIKAGFLLALALALALTIVVPSVVQAKGIPNTIGQGFEFFSGKYGTTARTDTMYAPFAVSVNPTERLNLSLEIPFIYQNNGNIVSGISINKSQNATTASAVTSSSTSANQEENGLGDIILRAGYTLVPDTDSTPQVHPTAFIKFPTADKNKSLGTGEYDEGFAVEISKWLGKWYSSVEAGYTVQGRSSQFALRNYLTYNAGIGYRISNDIFTSFLISGTSPPGDGTGSILEAQLKMQYQLTQHAALIGSAVKGISTYSPDYGTGLVICYSF